MAANKVTLGAYLLARLEELGALIIQGVPGDYNMGFLDLIEDHKTLRWVGNCNELNAAYSADGYARTQRAAKHAHRAEPRIGALVTTFGVGELSALNGVAGAFSERLPLVHIVGVPSTSAQGQKALLHHTLGDGRFDAFEEMSRKISIALTKLEDYIQDPHAAVAALDRVLAEGVKVARPVYISLPTDMVHLEVPDDRLQKKLEIELPPNDADAEKDCLDIVLKQITNAKDPVIIVDACAIRHGVVFETRELVDASGLSVFATPMGKSAIDESHPQFGGIYVGSNTIAEVKERVESADLLIQVGAILSDFNTASFSYRTPRSATVGLHSDRIEVGFATFQNVRMKQLLPKLSAALRSHREQRLQKTRSALPQISNTLPTHEEEVKLGGSPDPEAITQAYLWPRMGQFLEGGDQVIAETGTSSFGSLAIRLPSSQLPCFHSQVLWGSIGWSLPATLGVSLATREEATNARVVLFIGDGSFQLTAQEVSTMVRENLSVIIFVLANDGYEIERQIHGPERRYNNTARWDLKSFLSTFSDVNKTNDVPTSTPADSKASHKKDPQASKLRFDSVRTKTELDALLKDAAYARQQQADAKGGSGCVRLCEIIIARGDAPKALLGQAAATQQSNKY